MKRCVVCGHALNEPETVYRIARGTLVASFSETEEWGYAHSRCFAQSVRNPELVLAELKRVGQPPA
jgi:hypothetical protein